MSFYISLSSIKDFKQRLIRKLSQCIKKTTSRLLEKVYVLQLNASLHTYMFKADIAFISLLLRYGS